MWLRLRGMRSKWRRARQFAVAARITVPEARLPALAAGLATTLATMERLLALEYGDAERFIELMRGSALSNQFSFTDQELGLDRVGAAAFQLIGTRPSPWYFSYRVRMAFK